MNGWDLFIHIDRSSSSTKNDERIAADKAKSEAAAIKAEEEEVVKGPVKAIRKVLRHALNM